jgi:endonuclease YncB( thermonuclease family)
LGRKVIGFILVLGVATAAVLFAVNYWFKPASKPEVPPPYYEVIATVVWMIDGDTTWVRIENIVAELDPEGEVYVGEYERVRYGGGIDAPEIWTDPPRPGSVEAKELVESLIPLETTVYLDLNDLSRGGRTGRPYRGQHERLIAVIYARVGGQWVNINAEVLRWGLEEYPEHNWLRYIDYPSEWDPYKWLENDYPYLLGPSYYRVKVEVSPLAQAASSGEEVIFTLTIMNEGTENDTYEIRVSSVLGWPIKLSQEEVTVPAGYRAEVTIAVKAPEVNERTTDFFTVTVTGTEVRDSDVFRLLVGRDLYTG